MKQGSFFDHNDADDVPRSSHGPFALTANIDGGARGNPGPAAYGVVLRDSSGKIVAELGEYLGIQTNNIAEYSALLAALDYVQREKIASLRILSDSELLVKQMRGQYRVKNPDLRALYDRAQAMVRKLERFSIAHVLRGSNKDADRLVNQVLDKQERRRQI